MVTVWDLYLPHKGTWAMNSQIGWPTFNLPQIVDVIERYRVWMFKWVNFILKSIKVFFLTVISITIYISLKVICELSVIAILFFGYLNSWKILWENGFQHWVVKEPLKHIWLVWLWSAKSGAVMMESPFLLY